VPAHAAVDDAVAVVRARFGAKLAGFVNAVLRKLARHGEPALPSEPRARWAIEHGVAPWLIDEVAAQVPADELPAAIAALTAPAPLWIRVNRTRATVDEVVAELTDAGARVAPSPFDPRRARGRWPRRSGARAGLRRRPVHGPGPRGPAGRPLGRAGAR
jgi:16S rRNA (cytosine967-C5)-methyltransferase